MIRAVSRLNSCSSVLLVCDIQERFRDLVCDFNSIVVSARHLLAVSKVLKVPSLVTEQYPKAFGHTVKELQAEVAGKLGACLLALRTTDNACAGVGAANVYDGVVVVWCL